MSHPARKTLTNAEVESAYRYLAKSFGDIIDKRDDRMEILASVIPPGDIGGAALSAARANERFWPTEAALRQYVSEAIARLTPPPSPPPGMMTEDERSQLLPSDPAIAATAIQAGRELLNIAAETRGQPRDVVEVAGLQSGLIDALWVDRLARNVPAATSRPTVLGSRCDRCGGARMCEKQRSNEWYPCPACNRPAYLKWKEGHYAPGHECAECAPSKARPT